MGSDKTAYEDTADSGNSRYSSNTTNINGDTAMVAFRSFPNNFIWSGYVSGSSVEIRGSYGGFYWSSTAAYYSIFAYNLSLSGYDVTPGTGNVGKPVGLTVRCLALSLIHI